MNIVKILLIALSLNTIVYHANAQSKLEVTEESSLTGDSAPTFPGPSWKGIIKETRDEHGRLTKVETLSGVEHNFSYDQSGRVAQMQDHVGNVTIAVYRTPDDQKISGIVKLPLSHSVARGFGSKQMSLYDGGIDPYTGGDLIEFYQSQGDLCALVCLGIWDSVNSFVGNLANWIGVGAAFYGTLGAIEGVLSGAAGAEVLGWFGLGALAGTAVVIAFAGGWLVGTEANNGINYIIYADGRVIGP